MLVGIPGRVVAIFVGALVLQLLALDPALNLYDEGIILVGAERITHGEMPYRDFWTMYGPAEYYVVSWFFSWFGYSDLSMRAVSLISKAATIASSFWLIDRLASRRAAVWGAAAVAGVLMALRFEGFPVFPALAFSLFAIIFVARSLEGKRWSLFFAGLATGAAAIFRHDLGAYGAVAIGVCLLLRRVDTSIAPRSAQMRELLLDWLTYGLGVLVIMGPALLALLQSMPASDLYEDLLRSPSRIYPSARSLPFPGFAELVAVSHRRENPTIFAVYAPFVIGLAALVLTSSRDAATSHSVGKTTLTRLLAITCLLFTLKGMVRVSNIHMVQALVIATILAVVFVDARIWRHSRQPRLVLGVLGPFVVLLAVISLDGLNKALSGTSKLVISDNNLINRCATPSLPRAACVNVDPDYVAAARAVAELSEPGDPIYVGTTRHDKILINAVALYFLAQRKPATRWHELHPGLQTEAPIQKAMIEEFERTPPRVVILDSRWDEVQEPNSSRLSSGVRLLDDYIASHYVEVRRFGSVRVLSPRATDGGFR